MSPGLFSLKYFFILLKGSSGFCLLILTFNSFLFSIECEQEIQWLKEAGFDAIVKKYNGKIYLRFLGGTLSFLMANKLLHNIAMPV